MPLSRSHKTILVIAGLVLCVGSLLAFFYLLPFYLETRLLPRWAEDAGLDPQTIRMRRIGLSGSDTGPIRLNMGDQSFAAADAVQIDYSPASLLAGRINAIVLCGLNLSLFLDEDGTAVTGWRPRVSGGAAGDRSVPVAELPQKVPIGLGRLALHNALVTVHWRGRMLAVPLDADVDTSRLGQGHLEAEVHLSPRGAPIHLGAEMETDTNTLSITISAQEVETARFSDLVTLFADAKWGARIDLAAKARCRLQPLALTAMTGEIRLSGITAPSSFLRIAPPGGPESKDKPIAIRWETADGRNFPWTVAPFSLQGAATLQVDGLQGRLSVQTQGWNAEATSHLVLPPQSLSACGLPPLSLRDSLALDLNLSARQEKGKALQWQVHTADGVASPTENKFCVQLAQWGMESQAPRIDAAGEVIDGTLTGHYDATLNDLAARHPSARLDLPAIRSDGEFRTAPAPCIQSTANLSGLQIRAAEAAMTLPRIDTRLTIEKEEKNWVATGEMALSGGQAQYEPQAVQLRDIAVRLPVRYPPGPRPPTGEVRIDQILWRSRNLGSARGKVGLGSSGLWAELRHASKLFPGINVQMRSELDSEGAHLNLAIPATPPAAAMDLGRILPAAEGFRFLGRFEAHAQVRAKGNTIQSKGRIRIDRGALRHEARQLSLEGIACDFRLENLIPLRSEPRQQLHVADLALGKLAARELNVDFQLEPQGTLFIEKAGMQWCQGTMQTQAFRLVPGRDEVEATIYCDRLNLAMLLEQLGAAQGSGEGAVNGRIPLLWKDGMLRFDNGFLYSTPGQTGTIRLSGTETLLKGLAPGSPQHTQLDIASEALKDYSYNWAKVDLRSEEDLLLVSLKLDGKPNRLLPFAYDPQSGAFKRFSGQGQAEFQGINIDLNFKTPLREILHYRQLMAPKN